MGMRYLRGEGVPRDPEQAVDLLIRGAEKGDLEAQKNLGAIYLSGDGIAADPDKAYEWLTIVLDTKRTPSPANQQFVDEVLAEARRLRERAAARLTPAEIAEARQRAADWIAARADG
jgi:hypothetical protein